jgi:hypothetical protein
MQRAVKNGTLFACIRQGMQIREKLVQEGTLPATVSVSTIQRCIKHNGLKSLEEASVKDRKAYEEEYFGGNVESHAGMARQTPVTCHISGKMGSPVVFI